MIRGALALSGALFLSCATTPPPAISPPAARGTDDSLAAPGTLEEENVALARRRGHKRLFSFQPYGAAAFQQARGEGRFLLLHGAAEWCHWCHVMEATTYLDPEVGALLRDRFVAIRVDIDERPDIAERYADWGWPATVILSPEAEELGKFKGYLPKERMLDILRGLLSSGKKTPGPGLSVGERLADLPAPPQAMAWIGARVLHDLDDRYDRELGGWGQRQKAPLPLNVEWELVRAAHGDKEALARATFTIERQRALLDPVWGGFYQYSTHGDWDHAHFEKLLPIQAASIEAAARAYLLTRNQALLADGLAVAAYLNKFLSDKDGAFLVSQDADVGAHDDKARFVDGHVYYGRSDAGRRALGMPRIDDHAYARESGLGIAAFAALYGATGEEAHLSRARRAADLMLRTHLLADGAVRREAGKDGVRFVADAAALGRGLARLAEVLGPGPIAAPYRQGAVRIAQALWRDFGDGGGGPLWVSTRDPAASGVFARRARPFAPNVAAARFLCALSRVTGDDSHRRRAEKLLGEIATPRGLLDEGRMVGEFLLALDEAKLFPWR